MMKKLLIFGIICMILGAALNLFLMLTTPAHGQTTRHATHHHRNTLVTVQRVQLQQLQQPYSNQFPPQQPTQNPFPYQQQQPTYPQQYPPQLQQQFQQPPYQQYQQSNQTGQPLYNPNQVVACLNNVLSEAILKANNTKDPLYISNATLVLDRCIVPGR